MSRKTIVLDYVKYPFLVDVKEYIKKSYGPGVELIDVIAHDPEGKIVSRARDRVIGAIRGSIPPAPPNLTSRDEIVAFHIGLLISAIVGDQWLRRRVAVVESKRAHGFLREEPPEVLVYVASKLGLKIEYLSEPLRLAVGYKGDTYIYEEYWFKIKIEDYLRYSRLLVDTSWKLVNQPVKDGYVYLNRRRTARIISEEVYNYLNDKIKPVNISIPALREHVEAVRREIAKAKKSRGEIELGELGDTESLGVIVEAFPPCIRVLYDNAIGGGNLPHHGRFALATFMINIGASVDAVIDVFRKTPDFNEPKARYQVEHLAGLRGGRKKYMPYSCDMMRTLGLCVAECNVKHPLVEYRRRIRRIKLERRASASKSTQ